MGDGAIPLVGTFPQDRSIFFQQLAALRRPGLFALFVRLIVTSGVLCG